MHPSYSRQKPFLASITERVQLTSAGSQKKTQHLVLDLKGSGISYAVGDSVGVLPQHAPELVNKTLRALKANGQERVRDKQTESEMPLRDYLTHKGNINSVSPKLFKEIVRKQTNNTKKENLETLSQETHRDAYKKYIGQHEIWDFLIAHEEVSFSPQEFIDLLMPLLPRFYSIASSQKHVGDEIHITIAPLEYMTNGHTRRGICTHYLCDLVPLHTPTVPVFIQSAHGFGLPEDPHIPLIMVGPGTGVAPFRAFLQERLFHHRSSAKHWLFFGERSAAHDFLYAHDWSSLAKQGDLRLDLAFSRDQEDKIYVQHKMWESGKELYDWLEEGAYLYVCGDAERMAKDVEATLHRIIEEYGKMCPQTAKDYVKKLRQQKRYLRDVY